MTTVPDLAERLRLVVMRLARHLRQQTSDGDVTPSQLAALHTLWRLGPLPLTQLAAVERVQPPSMSKVVASLEAAGMIQRAPDAADGRVSQVRLTREGAAYVERGRRRRTVYLAGRLKRLTADEREAVAAALPVLERLLEEEEGSS